MAEGRSKSLWSHTSEVLAIIAEANRDPEKRSSPFTASMFNPHVPKKSSKQTPLKVVSMRELHSLMPDLPGQMAELARGRK